mmetsp:Transcript_7466/g.19281  ORF Transcript_7466/g.19281 Transcript_7466/m.19281 type:complete len:97 (+) Transcript_7466:415-705(+)
MEVYLHQLPSFIFQSLSCFHPTHLPTHHDYTTATFFFPTPHNDFSFFFSCLWMNSVVDLPLVWPAQFMYSAPLILTPHPSAHHCILSLTPFLSCAT